MSRFADPSSRFRLSAIVTAIYWTALAVTTHAPLDSEALQPDGFVFPPWFDKVYHFVAFALLAALLSTAWNAYVRRKHGESARTSWRAMLCLTAIVAVYAALDEVTQPLTGRFCDVWDWTTDVAGAVCGALARRRYKIR